MTRVKESLLDVSSLVDSVREMLRAAPYLPMRSIQCRIEGERLILTGSVPSYYMKQLVQTRVGALCPSFRLDNLVKVSDGVPDSTID